MRELIAAARTLGEALCEAAIWHEDRCSWMGRSPREVSDPRAALTPTLASLGPELYGGTAGIALFLAELHACAGLSAAARTARGAIQHALARVERDGVRGGFYDGALGTAYATVRVGELSRDAGLVARGIALARRAAALELQLLDLVAGVSGAIAPLIVLARVPGGDALAPRARELADQLSAAAIDDDGGLRWDVQRASGPGLGTRSLCGFAHGTSGMALALIEAGVAFDRGAWVDRGLAALAYEDRLYDRQARNWPDLREQPGQLPGVPTFMTAWCHGAPGIGLARLRAAKLLPRRRRQLELGLGRARRATEHWLARMPVEADATPCHGRGGLAEVMLHAPGREARRAATGSWLRAIRHARKHGWRSGVPSGGDNPSLMLGNAGIGMALLRAAEPAAVPSPLVIEPPS
ncbi:MAG TPA: lanthionine synthetase LanC family protein [Kofleriaceae bacterium]|nr:lanthionine synthetase LanC family protein [Kofleriaceae bacterium]